jgi:hypothetical protein
MHGGDVAKPSLPHALLLHCGRLQLVLMPGCWGLPLSRAVKNAADLDSVTRPTSLIEGPRQVQQPFCCHTGCRTADHP